MFFAMIAGVALAAGDAEHWYMNEEWYDWHPRSEFASDKTGAVSVEIHFVGPGAITPRGLYLRGNADQPLERIEVSGIRDHQKEPWKSGAQLIKAAGTPQGKKWVRLATGSNPRGFEPLILKLPSGVTFDYVCISPNERYITDGHAEARIRDQDQGKDVRCGMPLGGIGAGKVEIARDGRFRNITINNNLDAPFDHPDLCFLTASINGQGRVLRDQGAMALAPVERIDFDARYPIAHLTFTDKAWPVAVKVRAWSPLIPGNVEDSSLPVAIFDLQVENHTEKAVKAELTLYWENLLGSGGRPQPVSTWDKTAHYLRFREDTGNTTTNANTDKIIGVFFAGGNKQEADSEGNYTLATPGGTGRRIGLIFSEEGEPPFGGLSIEAEIAPGKTLDVPVVLAWHMDHFYQLGKQDLGHYYANRFKNSREVAEYVLANRERLFTETSALPGLFDRSDLPRWFTGMLLNDLYTLLTNTWLTRDGRFSVNESPTNMYGCMGTLDQKLYASHHLALLFPQLQKQELRQFGNLQNDNGGITHDLGLAEFVEKSGASDWPDLCSSFSLLSYQVYRYTGDKAFWDEIRPKVLKAIRCLATTWDPEGLGVPGRGSTFDDEDTFRIFSYTTALWLCDLRLGMAIAKEMGDDALLADFTQRFERTKTLAMKELWTGKYFRYGSSPPPENKRTDASHFSQLAGDFWARVLGLDDIHDPSVRQAALESLLRLHWNSNFKMPPKIVTAEGKLFPRDGSHRNAPGSWPMHARALMCGNAFLFGQERQGWDLLKAMHDNIAAANGPDPWDQSLFYDPFTSRYDWGVFYMTSPASWLAYQALIDTHYDAVAQILTLRPTAAAKVVPGKFPILTPTFWAGGEVSADGQKLSVRVERVLAREVAVKAIRVAPGSNKWTAAIDGQTVTVSVTGDRLTFDAPIALKPGLRITLKQQP